MMRPSKNIFAPPSWGGESMLHDRSEVNSVDFKTNREGISNASEKTDIIHDVADAINNVAPTMLFEDICSASIRINDGIIKTPCEKSSLSDSLGCDVYFKKEFLQASRSFKDRCACNIMMLLTDPQILAGVVTASCGNFGCSMAYHAQQIGIVITIVMPNFTPIMKIKICRSYGADVIIWGSTLNIAKEYAVELSKEKGSHYVDSFDNPITITGAGTIGLEIVEQIPDVDAVIVPVGSGVLIAGISLAVKTLKPSVKIIGVESETCPNFSLSLEAGKPITVHPKSSLADELAVSQVGQNAYNIAAPLVDRVIVTEEDSIALAVLRMTEKEKIPIEGSGACGLAALMTGGVDDLLGKKVVVCLTEANMNTTSYRRCLERGLAVDGRLVRFAVTVRDQPGAISELVELISKLGINVKNLHQHTAWVKEDIFSAKVEVICETRNKQHSIMLEKELSSHYTHVDFFCNFERS